MENKGGYSINKKLEHCAQFSCVPIDRHTSRRTLEKVGPPETPPWQQKQAFAITWRHHTPVLFSRERAGFFPCYSPFVLPDVLITEETEWMILAICLHSAQIKTVASPAQFHRATDDPTDTKAVGPDKHLQSFSEHDNSRDTETDIP